MFFLFFPMVKNKKILPKGVPWPIWPRGKYATAQVYTFLGILK